MDTTTLTAATITDEQIRNLCVRAGEHGDMDINGSKAAKTKCAKVLNDAATMNDE
jgi:hypothetical protein